MFFVLKNLSVLQYAVFFKSPNIVDFSHVNYNLYNLINLQFGSSFINLEYIIARLSREVTDWTALSFVLKKIEIGWQVPENVE